MISAERAALWAWVLWMLSWWAAAVWRKPAQTRASPVAELVHLPITMLGFVLLFGSRLAVRWGFEDSSLGYDGFLQGSAAGEAAGWSLLGLTLAGFAFCWWARIHLGALWSGSITRKQDHRIIESGPYGLVRHPIYTGLILSAAATAALQGTGQSLLGAALIAMGFWLKARLEERFLRAELGPAEYDAYAARTPMLIPRFGASRT